jgi:ankyrin repeat protein
MVKMLVEAGADLAALDDEHGGTPMQWAEVAIDVTHNPACKEVVEYLNRLGTIH